MDVAQQTQNVARGIGVLPAWRQVAIMIGLAASVAIGVAVVLWAREPNFTLLYGDLAEKDASQVITALDSQKVPYKVDQGSGAILVPSSRVYDVRLKLAADGLPKGSGMGFEMLQKDQSFGTSNFIETARYQRALEGELARSVATIDNVKSARVHLAIPKQTVFIRKQDKPTASVLVDLYPGRSLDPGQVSAVVHLVASSVPQLRADNVTVVDQTGKLLSGTRHDNAMGLSDDQLAYTQRIEQRYADRITNLLSPLVGAGGVRAQVNADVDFSTTEKTRESYNPDLPAVRSEQVTEQKTVGAGGAGGVPGALSNQPPGGGTTAAGGAGQQAAGGEQSVNSSRSTTRNYELDRTISHTKVAAGQLRRLSIAVVLDNKRGVGTGGAATSTPLSPEELARITDLVKDAVGFDTERGDTINVVNTAFQAQPVPAPLPATPFYQRPWVQDLAKNLLGVIGVALLIFGVLRPLLKGLAEKGASVPAGRQMALAGGGMVEGGEMGEDQISLTGGQAAARLGGPKKSYDDKLQVARQMVGQDPRVVAQVVKGWVAKEEE